MTVTVLVTVADQGLSFTDRQVEIVKLLAAGYVNKEIADRLGIALRTSQAHVDVIREKLGGILGRQIPLAFMEATGIDPYPRLEQA